MIIEYDQLKSVLGFPPKARLGRVVEYCDRNGIPYKRSLNGIFTTEDALTEAISGKAKQAKKQDEVVLL